MREQSAAARHVRRSRANANFFRSLPFRRNKHLNEFRFHRKTSHFLLFIQIRFPFFYFFPPERHTEEVHGVYVFINFGSCHLFFSSLLEEENKAWGEVLVAFSPLPGNKVSQRTPRRISARFPFISLLCAYVQKSLFSLNLLTPFYPPPHKKKDNLPLPSRFLRTAARSRALISAGRRILSTSAPLFQLSSVPCEKHIGIEATERLWCYCKIGECSLNTVKKKRGLKYYHIASLRNQQPIRMS